MPSSSHVIGEIFVRVYPGDPADAVHDEETLLVPPGSAAVVELSSPVPGDYVLTDHALFHASLGAMGKLRVEPTTTPTDGDPHGSWPVDVYGPPAWKDPSHTGKM